MNAPLSNLPLPLVPEIIGVTSADRPAEAGRKILLYYFAVMLQREPGTRLGEDIEQLHDMRVSTRRMRAALEIFGAAYKPKSIRGIAKGLKETARTLGVVRDWDVFLEKAHQDIAQLSPEFQTVLQPVMVNWQEQRNSARLKLLTHLESKAYRKFVQKLNTFVQTTGAGAHKPPQGSFSGQPIPLPDSLKLLAPGMLYERLAHIRAYEEILTQPHLDQLHALRIDFKRFHYLLDFLREILGSQGKTILQIVKQMQDHLGDLHDADIAYDMLEQRIQDRAKHSKRLSTETQPDTQALQAYLILKSAERQKLLDTFPAAWNHFNQPELRHLLAQALSEL